MTEDKSEVMSIVYQRRDWGRYFSDVRVRIWWGMGTLKANAEQAADRGPQVRGRVGEDQFIANCYIFAQQKIGVKARSRSRSRTQIQITDHRHTPGLEIL